MSGLTPINTPPSSGVITISSGDSKVTGDGGALMYVRPNRMASLPDAIIAAEIFPRLATKRNFTAFSETCSHMYTISGTIPIYAFPTGSLRDLIYFHNTKLKGAATQLVQSVDIEPSTSFDGNQLCFCSPELLSSEDAFYTTFKNCCFQLNTRIDCREFFVHCKTGYRSVNRIATRGNLHLITQKEILNERMFSLFLRLHERVYNELINISTDQLNTSLTFNSFKSSIDHIKENFFSKSEIDIEASLRNSLRIKYGATFERYAFEYLNAAPTSKIVAEIQKQLRAPLEAEKAEIEAEIAILCGPNRFNGTINDAYMEMEALTNMEDSPEVKFDVAFAVDDMHEAFGRSLSDSEILSFSYIDLDMIIVSNKIRNAHATLRCAFERTTEYKRNAAKAKFDELVARLKTLAQWEESTGILIGGKLFEICNKLANTGYFLSQVKVKQRGQFYAELACPVTEENKQERYNALLKFSEAWAQLQNLEAEPLLITPF